MKPGTKMRIQPQFLILDEKMHTLKKVMIKNERKINYMVGLARKINDIYKSWTGKEMNFVLLFIPACSGSSWLDC